MLHFVDICFFALYIIVLLAIILEVIIMKLGGYKFRSIYTVFIVCCLLGVLVHLLSGVAVFIDIPANWRQSLYDLHVPLEAISFSVMILYYFDIVHEDYDPVYKVEVCLYFVGLFIMLTFFGIRVAHNFTRVLPRILVRMSPIVSSGLILICSLIMLIYAVIWGKQMMTVTPIKNKRDHFILYIFQEILYFSLNLFHFIINILVTSSVLPPYYPISDIYDLLIIFFFHILPIFLIIMIAHKFHISSFSIFDRTLPLEQDNIVSSFILAHSYSLETSSDMNVEDLLEEGSMDKDYPNPQGESNYGIGLRVSKTFIRKNSKESPLLPSEII